MSEMRETGKRKRERFHLCNPLSMRRTPPSFYAKRKKLEIVRFEEGHGGKRGCVSIRAKHPKVNPRSFFNRLENFLSLKILLSRNRSFPTYDFPRYLISHVIQAPNENHLSLGRKIILIVKQDSLGYSSCLGSFNLRETFHFKSLFFFFFFNWKIYESGRKRERNSKLISYFEKKIYFELIEEATIKRTCGGSWIFCIHIKFVGFSANRGWSWRISRETNTNIAFLQMKGIIDMKERYMRERERTRRKISRHFERVNFK